MKTVIIVGYQGQDGQLLYNDLKKKYSIVGIGRKSTISKNNDWSNDVDITDYKSVKNIIKSLEPDYVYYLAAVHHSSSDKIESGIDLNRISFEINVNAFLSFLISINNYSPKTKIFYASSCHIFGDPQFSPQNEKMEYKPNSIYGITKMNGLELCDYFRTHHNLFASAGILFNHESYLRKNNFVSKNIVNTAVSIKNGLSQKLVIGNIEMLVDWGYAGDFVEAMQNILNLEKSDNFVISNGKSEPLENYISSVFSCLDLNWKEHTVVDPSILKRKPIEGLCGDYSKLHDMTGWTPRFNLKKLGQLMVKDAKNQVK